jgi:scyllo-inositol 2-dehydrogenase (NADP+)
MSESTEKTRTIIGSEPEPIPTAVVGYGFAGRDFHTYLVSLEPGLQLTAVATRDEGRRAAAAETYPDIRTYATLDELLEKDDARLVIMATPHDTHEPLAVKALRAGRHVVVDKAMCLTVAEADNMIDAAESNHVMLSVFHNRRWDGDYLTLRSFIDSGALGDVFLIEECVMGYGQPGSWRGEKQSGGGPLYDWGAHFVDHAVQIGGTPKWVFCDTQRHKWTTDVETYVKCQIKFESGLLYTVEVGYIAKLSKPKLFALGSEGAFRKEGVDPQERFMIQKRIREAVEDPDNRASVKTTLNGIQTEIRPETIRGDWTSYYRNIAEHLSQGVELAVKPEGVRTAIHVIESAMKSAAEGQVVYL